MRPDVGPLETPAPPLDLSTLGRYELLEEIGAGMMGVVYRGRDPLLNRIVALKTVRARYSMAAQERRSFEERFLVEARAAAALSHPGVVTVHDCGKDVATETLFIAFEYLEGQSLDEVLGSGRPMEWPRALDVALHLAEALDHAHRRGVIHRDIKPGNIMVLPSGEPKIMDFGIAKLPTSALTLAGDIIGTPSYMSPEQAVGEAVDGRSDLFSLGVVLYALLTGKRPFEGASLPAIVTHLVHSQPSPPSQVVPGLPPEIDGLVAKAIAKCPEDRFQDAREFANAIRALRGGPEAVEDREASSESGAPRRFARASRVALVAAAALVAPLFVVMGSPPSPRSAAPSAAPPPTIATPSPAAPRSISTPVPAPTPTPVPVRLPAPGRLEIAFQHSLKQGTLQVLVDEKAILTRPLDKEKEKALLLKHTAQGRVLGFSPGSHSVRVQVQSGKDVWAGRIQGTFKSGETLRLKAKLGGFLGKKLSLEWQG